jgi:signal transduction histidine kinase/CheY-like chemotaxis protein
MRAERRLYNSRIIQSYVNLLKKRYQSVDLKELLQHAGITPYEVSDEGQWFTQTQVDRFHDKLTEMLGGMEIAREAGRYSASDDSMGLMNKYLLGMIGPANTFAAIRKSSIHFTKSSIYNSRRLAANKVEITVTPVEGIHERPYQCLNRMGFYEAVITVFNFGVPEIEHTECMFKGGECCKYIVSWNKPRYVWLGSLRNWLTPPLVLLCFILAPFIQWSLLYALLSAIAVFFLTCSYLTEKMQKNELSEAMSNLKETSDNLLEQVGGNYNNARMVNEVGQAISSQRDIDHVLENVIRAIENRFLYDRCVVLLADPEKTRLSFRTGFGYTDEQLAILEETDFNLANPDSRGVFVLCFREQRPILVNDFSELTHYHSPRSVSLSEKMEARSFLCCAIVCEGESLGVLAVDNLKTNKKMTQSDINLLMGIAPAIGVSIRNAMYIERERRMAEQMRHSQKMEAVGQLAGGIAHDFNNLITAIIGFASLTEMSLPEGHPARKYVEQVLLASDRASNLTQGLLTFSRKQESNPKPVDLNVIVDSVKKLLARLISAEIELRIDLNREPLQVVADPGQIDQILMNLVTNARDAMGGTGVLTISTSVAEMTEESVQAQGYGSVGTYAILSVSDTGSGMDETTRAKIFEPFFTTKEVGKGTGLGLAIVYGIVQQHKAHLDIKSQPDLGTTFNIYFPLQRKQETSAAAVEESAPSYAGTETVLVAEDAPEVRRLTAELLTRNGYQVIEATDGQDALEKFFENAGEVDLVILDVVMPKMNGKETYSEMAKVKPRTKVLFTSGYTPDDVKEKGVAFDAQNFLPKPSAPHELLTRVRELLAA